MNPALLAQEVIPAGSLISLGVGGVLAGIVLMFYRQDHRESTDRYAALAKHSLEQYASLIRDFKEIVQDNTRAITANTEVIRASGLCPLQMHEDKRDRAIRES